MIQDLLPYLAWFFCAIPLHELGHYVTARRIGAKNIKLKLWKWKKIPMGVAVHCEVFEADGVTMPISQFLSNHFKITMFQLSGVMFEGIGIACFVLLGLFSYQWAFLMMFLTLAYGYYEATTPSFARMSESR